MDPIVILILAMVVLGLSQISISYAIKRAEQNARNMGDVLFNLAKQAGWKVTQTNDGGCILERPDNH